MKKFAALLVVPLLQTLAADRPNILWLSSEDHGVEMGCYGDAFATTPNVDGLAKRGSLFSKVWSCAPVCAPARTTVISGMFPMSCGAEHMRSMVPMPKGTKMFPELLREAGYYTSNNSKEDYNLEKKPATGWSEASHNSESHYTLLKSVAVWDESSGAGHWRKRAAGQPFFSVFNSTKSHESQVRARPHTAVHDPAKVRVPAYHPDTKESRQDWAQYYDVVSEADESAGKFLAQLEADGLADDTIVFYWGDHGAGMPRSKRWPMNSGLHVPLVVYVPAKFKALAPEGYAPGAKLSRMVSFVDYAPTMLSIAGIKPPEWMQGSAFMGSFTGPAPEFLFGFRGRMDERIDLVRSVTDGRFVYVRQFMPHLIYGQNINYMMQNPTAQVWKRMYEAGELKPPQTFFWERKPAEELYDLHSDRDEVNNLAGKAEHAATLEKFRAALKKHTLEIRDVGLLPESEVLRRAKGESPYEFGHDPKQYDIEKIFAAADEASQLNNPAPTKGFADADSGVRYWAAMGVLMRGAAAVESRREKVRALLADESPAVRVVAARALGQFGNADDLAKALPVLESLASKEKNGAAVSIEALNAIDALGAKAEPLHAALRAMPDNDAKGFPRLNEYPSRLLETILGTKPEPKVKRKK